MSPQQNARATKVQNYINNLQKSTNTFETMTTPAGKQLYSCWKDFQNTETIGNKRIKLNRVANSLAKQKAEFNACDLPLLTHIKDSLKESIKVYTEARSIVSRIEELAQVLKSSSGLSIEPELISEILSYSLDNFSQILCVSHDWNSASNKQYAKILEKINFSLRSNLVGLGIAFDKYGAHVKHLELYHHLDNQLLSWSDINSLVQKCPNLESLILVNENELTAKEEVFSKKIENFIYVGIKSIHLPTSIQFIPIDQHSNLNKIVKNGMKLSNYFHLIKHNKIKGTDFELIANLLPLIEKGCNIEPILELPVDERQEFFSHAFLKLLDMGVNISSFIELSWEHRKLLIAENFLMSMLHDHSHIHPLDLSFNELKILASYKSNELWELLLAGLDVREFINRSEKEQKIILRIFG